MKIVLRHLLKGLGQGSAILALAFILPVIAVRVFAAEPQPAPKTAQDFIDSHNWAKRYQRGLVLEADRQRCGCPPVTKQVKWSRWPTRCRPANATLTATTFWPVNNRESSDARKNYPRVPYPVGYPAQFQLGPTIPFPGWPLKRFTGDVKDNLTPWTGESAGDYQKVYKDDWNGTPPSSRRIHASQSTVAVPVQRWPRAPWFHWQIHHVLERSLGGTNHPKNLVPVFSRANWRNPTVRSNVHNDFTQWWEHLTIDSDCQSDRVVWNKIRACREQAKVWPPGT